jgi:hypothetical protein
LSVSDLVVTLLQPSERMHAGAADVCAVNCGLWWPCLALPAVNLAHRISAFSRAHWRPIVGADLGNLNGPKGKNAGRG